MNEEYVKYLMKQNKEKTAIQLWAQFVGIQLFFGLLLLGIVGLCLLVAGA